MAPLTRARAAAEAPSLLDALARAPAAAALVVAALKRVDDRRALRLACTQLRDAVGEATAKLTAWVYAPGGPAARPPTPRRWPRLEELRVGAGSPAALEALGSDTWGALRALWVQVEGSQKLSAPAARALAAALPRMPALRALELWRVLLPDAAAAELFRAASAASRLRSLTTWDSDLSPAGAHALAASGWPLEELSLPGASDLGAAGVTALVAAPIFALRRLNLFRCGLDAAALLARANAPWPLEELELAHNDFSGPQAAPALAALSRNARLRKLDVSYCRLSAAGFKALVEAAWPALTSLGARGARVKFDGPHALGAAAFAGFPALEELDLSSSGLGAEGARLASRHWPRLKKLVLRACALDDAGLAALCEDSSWC
jgi:hypothetical protein